MKMTLDQLKVDSYATQVSENELTEIKGGTWLACLRAAAKLAAAVIAVDQSIEEYQDSLGYCELTPASEGSSYTPGTSCLN